MSLEEHALWDTAVLNLVLNDVHCVIIQVVVDGALSDTVVLVGVLNYGLLEVGFELQYLIFSDISFPEI